MRRHSFWNVDHLREVSWDVIASIKKLAYYGPRAFGEHPGFLEDCPPICFPSNIIPFYSVSEVICSIKHTPYRYIHDTLIRRLYQFHSWKATGETKAPYVPTLLFSPAGGPLVLDGQNTSRK